MDHASDTACLTSDGENVRNVESASPTPDDFQRERLGSSKRQTVQIEIAEIRIGDRLRAVTETDVATMAASLSEIGLRTPITVRRDAAALHLVAGHTRLKAAQRLGWETIETFISEGSGQAAEIDAALWEIDENLVRCDLTPAQEGAHLLARKELWTRHRGGGNSPTGFASDLSSLTGEGKREINRKLSRAGEIGVETLNRIVATALDKGVELEALAKLQPAARELIVKRAVAGEQVSARVPSDAPKRKAERQRPFSLPKFDSEGFLLLMMLASFWPHERIEQVKSDVKSMSPKFQKWMDEFFEFAARFKEPGEIPTKASLLQQFERVETLCKLSVAPALSEGLKHLAEQEQVG